MAVSALCAGVFEVRIVDEGRLRRVDTGNAAGVVEALPLRQPLSGSSVRVRADDLLPQLAGADDSNGIVSALRAAGLDLSQAQLFAAALGSAGPTAEIVAVDVEGRVLPGAVAVFCSPRGDVVSVPSTAADGGRWFTLAPATPRRVALACADLVAGSRVDPARVADPVQRRRAAR